MNGRKTIYTMKNISKVYLSPYCFVQKMDDGFHIKRTDNSRSFVFYGDYMDELLEMLKNGLEVEELFTYLTKFIGEEADSWISMVISEGFLI